MGLCRYLGNTSVKLPALGQGTTQTGSYAISTDEGDRQRIGVLRLGIELGMSLIDTAELYGGGHSEEVVGTAIKGIRDNVFLASKFRPENSTAEGLMRAIEGSLRRLQTDYLDLYQWHWPNPQVPLEETLDALLTLKSQGKIRFIGVSNFTVKELETARSHGGPSEIASTQVEYNLSQRAVERDVLPYCQREHVTLLAYSPLGGGSTLVDGRRSRLLRDIGEKYEKSAAQIALRWLLTRASVIPIVKSSDPKHTLENAQAAKFELDREDIERIDRGVSPAHYAYNAVPNSSAAQGRHSSF